MHRSLIKVDIMKSTYKRILRLSKNNNKKKAKKDGVEGKKRPNGGKKKRNKKQKAMPCLINPKMNILN